MKRLLLAALAGLCVIPVYGQGVRFDSLATTVQTNMPAGANAPVLAIPGARVMVCTDSACGTLASTYQDQGLTVASPNPIIAGAATPANLAGKWGFWAASGTYWYKITTTQGVVYGPYPLTLGGSASGGGATFPGTAGIVYSTSSLTARNAVLGDLLTLGAAPAASPTFSGTVTLSNITGSTQCLHVNSFGGVSGTGVDCGSGGGGGMTQLTGDVTAGPGSGSQAATLANTAVAAGSYTNANITVDAKGRLTSAANGSTSSGTVTTTGTPAAGNLTRFSSATAITSTDLTGAVTTSGGVATTLANSAVATANIANSAVTLGKFQNAAANSKLIGSGSAGVGASYSELTIGTNLTMSGTTLNAGTGLVASGTATLGTSAIASATCATVVTVTATGVLSTDTIIWNPNQSIKAVVGYVPATTGGLSIAAYPTANAVNFDVCSWASASITPGALTLNWSVTR